MPGTKVLFENERVRVWDMTVPPGGSMEPHVHRLPYFYVVVEGGKMRFGGHPWHPPDGETEFYDLAPGSEKHDPRMVNEGDRVHREIVVELKD